MADSSGDLEEQEEGHVFVFDRRHLKGRSIKVSLGGLFDYQMFRKRIEEVFEIQDSNNDFVIVTTNRLKIASSQAYEEFVESGDTLYLLTDLYQDLLESVPEQIEYLPHYDTLVKSGMYEYYESAGQNPLCFAFAELIDNALAATANNDGPREIKLTIHLDSNPCANAVCVSDNGSGMTSKDLNNWAVYRLSKFNRNLKPGKNSQSLPFQKHLPRSLNSDVSYFGVGGKQAIFFIGSTTTVITKTKHSMDVHELTLSKQDFERREKKKEPVYSGCINNRRAGDSSHISPNNKILAELIENETGKKSFTNILITDIDAKQLAFLKKNFKYLCRQLTHLYHYYLHGPMGKLDNNITGMRLASPFRLLDIEVIVKEKGTTAHHVSLRDIEDDFESLLLRSTSSIFEFNAYVDGTNKIEGILRYHPFLYDKETFPDAPNAELSVAAVDQNAMEIEERTDGRGPRGDRPLFECFWNGRLIPYTSIEALDWCAPPKKKSHIPRECYYRVSGALFTDDSFQVSTNKLTFIDLEGRLRERNTIFNKVVMGQEQRIKIDRAFNEWVKECHENCDKQVKFIGFSGTVNRTDVAQKKNQGLWSVYKAVEWDGKTFKAGQLMRTSRTVPIVVGKIQQFYLQGEHEGDEVFATGGEIEIIQQPESLYGDVKILPLAKFDRSPTASTLKEFVRNEELKLPASLSLDWPDGNALVENAKIMAGSTIGPLKVDILNGKDESVNKIPGDRMKKLLLELKIISHSEKGGDKTVLQLTCQHGGKSWPYWFRKIENISDIGHHNLQLQVILSDSSVAGQFKFLPSLNIPFIVTEAEPEKLTIGEIEAPLQIGVPFQIPLKMHDKFDNIVKPSADYDEPILSATGMRFKFNRVLHSGNSFILKDVVAEGAVSSVGGKDLNLKVGFANVQSLTHTIRLRFLPGPPHELEVLQSGTEIENGKSLQFDVKVKDKYGNITSQPKLNVSCKVIGVSGTQPILCDCSSTGKGIIVSQPIKIKNITGKKTITAKFDLQNYGDVKSIEKEVIVTPSSKVSKIDVFYTTSDSTRIIDSGQDIQCVAGGKLTGLSFKIFDEGNRQLSVDQSSSSKIKVNWVGKLNKEDVKQGKLPDIKAPTLVDEVKYCQVSCSIGDGSVEHNFNLKVTHGEPSTLKPLCENIKFRLNESVSSDIFVSLHDGYGNLIHLASADLEYLTVSGEGLKGLLVMKNVNQDGHFVIKNVHFAAGLPGPRALCIQWKEIVSYQKLEMLPGVAVGLMLVGLDSKPIEVLNGNLFPKPIQIQLLDAAGNFAREKNIRCMLIRDSGLKLLPPPAQQRTNEDGLAIFNDFSVSAPRGSYSIIPKAMLISGSKEGPVILVSVEPDRTKPVQLLTAFTEKTTFAAGDKLPLIQTSVLSEDETPINTVKSKDIVLKLWSHIPNKTSNTPPQNAASFFASAGTLNEPKDHFFFRDVKVPERIGQYYFIIQYVEKGFIKLSSKKYSITVCPSKPVKLVPVTVPSTPTVSNTSSIESRQLIKNLKLKLKDVFGNTAGVDLQGMLHVSIESNGNRECPCLKEGPDGALFHFLKGAVSINQLLLAPDTKGVDGQEYVLSFQARLSGLESLEIEPFKLPFLFYDDIKKQAQMAELTKEKDELDKKISTYKVLFESRSQLLNEMQAAVRESTAQEQQLRDNLSASGYKDTNSLKARDQMARASSSLRQRKKEMENQPRRICRLPVGPQAKDIIGKVAHMALVREDDVARVLSWHMASDMDCVITRTTEQAKKVYDQTNGKQQVLPLDSIYRKACIDWKKRLPHVQISSIKPPRNVMFARDFLIFPDHEEECKIIFGMFLGDTIITDTLDDANSYRQEVVKHMYCPTILTRTGDRVRSNGKFGGLQNRAPTVERLNGVIFSSPLPPMYPSICAQIDTLANLEVAVDKVKNAKLELQLQLVECQSQELADSYAECLEAENQVRKIETKLGLTPRRQSLPSNLNHFFESRTPIEKGSNRRPMSKRLVDNNNLEEHTHAKRSRFSYDPQENSRNNSNNHSNDSTWQSRRKR